jgi:hypothetical protein
LAAFFILSRRYNRSMRILLALLLFACAGAAAALETARSLAESGAPRLALARVEQLQPRDPAAPRWAEWEALHLALLVELGRDEEALKRAAALPKSATGIPPAALRSCLLSAARAAVALGQGGLARTYAARLLWQNDAAPADIRTARLAVIDSYLAERQGETAFRAMLRYEQDYRPLDRDTAAGFVGGLLDLSLDKEAVNWLASLEDGGAMKLRLQLRTGLISPDVAITQARAQIVRRAKTGGGVDYWQVIAEAAARQGNGLMRLEALEHLLNQAGGNDPRAAQPSKALWQAYLAEAQATANRDRLLAGDDTAWADHAARRMGTSPQESRALFAYLVTSGKTSETRLVAQLQMAFSLHQGGLDYTAIHLFGGPEFAAGTLDTQVRYLLGDLADSHNSPAHAARFWQGLPPPATGDAAEWQLRLATVQWRTGAAEPALGTVHALAKAGRPLSAPAAGRALTLAREMLSAGRPGAAEETLAVLQPLTTGDAARDMLYMLGECAESAAQYARAADYYLRFALARGTQAPDAKAVRARLAAALNLSRAGLREDARAQFQWVIGNSRDAAEIEVARRELARF